MKIVIFCKMSDYSPFNSPRLHRRDNLMLMKTPSPSVTRSAAANAATPLAGGTMVKKPRPAANINQPGADVDRLLAVSPQQQIQVLNKCK